MRKITMNKRLQMRKITMNKGLQMKENNFKGINSQTRKSILSQIFLFIEQSL